MLGNGEEVFLKQLEVKKNQEVGGIPEYSKDDSFIQNSEVSHSEMRILGSGKDKVSLPISFVKPSAGTGWFIFLIKRLAFCFLFRVKQFKSFKVIYWSYLPETTNFHLSF